MKTSTNNNLLHTELKDALGALAAYYAEQPTPALTDIYIQLCPNTGELRMMDDDEQERYHGLLSSEQIKDNADTGVLVNNLRNALQSLRATDIEPLRLVRPYSFVLLDAEGEVVQDLLVIEADDSFTLDTDILRRADEELDLFFQQLMEE